MQLPQIVEQDGIRVLTTRQLTEWYKTEEWQIKQNFRNNKERFILGKHYITLQGEELKGFKSKVENIYLVGKTAKILYLWTEKGALLHAKSLNTDKAWEVYDYLVDFYFRVKEQQPKENYTVKLPQIVKPKDVKVKNPIPVFKNLLQLAENNGLRVDSYDFQSMYSCVKGKSIGIKSDASLERVDYELAYILAHVLIHCGEGDLINNPRRAEYDRRAERAAKMIIDTLDIAYA